MAPPKPAPAAKVDQLITNASDLRMAVTIASGLLTRMAMSPARAASEAWDTLEALKREAEKRGV